MSTRTPGGDVPIRRLDRILAFMSLGLAVVSIVCFFAIIIAPARRCHRLQRRASGRSIAVLPAHRASRSRSS